jgi:hypothetical protein
VILKIFLKKLKNINTLPKTQNIRITGGTAGPVVQVTTNVNPLSVTGTDHTDVVEVPSPHKQGQS